MIKKKSSSSSKDLPLRFRGERVVFAGKIDWQAEGARAVIAEGGKVLPKIDATTTIVVLGRNATTVMQAATQLNKTKKANIQLLSESQLTGLLAPSRDETLVLLRQGPKGVKRLQRLLLSDYYSYDPLVSVDIKGASLAGASLVGAELTALKLDRVDFRRADLTRANLGCDIRGANFDSANLTKANLGELKDCSLVSANLSGADISNGAPGSDFSKASLAKLGGSYAELKGAKFRSANLERADLEEANLASADLTNANLTGANLMGADLRKAKLVGAKLVSADLATANLAGADLTNANLEKATLTTANLTGAKMTGARLDGAKLAGAKLPKLDGQKIATPKGKIGPNLRELQRVITKSLKVKMELKIDLEGGGRAELKASVDKYGWVALEGTRCRGRKADDPFLDNETDFKVAQGLSKLANRYADENPTITEVIATARKCPLKENALITLVTNAWSEVLGIE